MKKMLSVCVALLIISALSGPVFCQDDSLVDNIKTVDGDVVSVNIQNSQITVRSSETILFFVPSSAKIVNKDGFGIQLSDVKAGNYVTVDYTDDKSGVHIMQGMEVAYKR